MFDSSSHLNYDIYSVCSTGHVAPVYKHSVEAAGLTYGLSYLKDVPITQLARHKLYYGS